MKMNLVFTRRLRDWLALLLAAPVWLLAAEPTDNSPAPLFSEGCDDSCLLQRGWYDGSRFTISEAAPFTGKGCLEYQWKDRGTTPAK
jgi:hypothetical protein